MNQEECLQIVRASTRARKYVVVQQNTVSAYVVAYLVDLAVVPSSSWSSSTSFEVSNRCFFAGCLAWLSCKLRSRQKLRSSSSSNAVFKVKEFVHIYANTCACRVYIA